MGCSVVRHCSMLRWVAVPGVLSGNSLVQYGAVLCRVVQCGAVLQCVTTCCSMVQWCSVVRCGAVRCGA